jgi:hypothetical protein
MEPWVKGLNLVHGNPSRFQSVEVDTLLETMKYSTDFEDSLSACWEVQEVLAEECPMIPIYDGINYKLARTDVWEPPFHGVSPETTDYWTVYNARLREYDGGPFGGNFRSGVKLATSLSPALGTTSSRTMLRFLYPGLGQGSHDLGEVTPSKLAETWIVEPTPTGQNIIFQLSERAIWSDGIPLTAADVAFSYDSLRQTSSRAYPVLELVSNIEIISDHTIRVEIDSPSYFVFQDLTLVPIIPRHICEGNDDYWEHLQHSTVTAGDFVCESARLEYDPGGPLEVSVTGPDLVSLGIPEVGDFIADGGEYRIAIDYISGPLPLNYVITAEVNGNVVGQIGGSINPDEDNVVPGWNNFETWAVEDYEPLQFDEGDHVTLTLDFNPEGFADLDLVCWASHESGFWRVEEATLVQRSIAGTVLNEGSNEPIPDAEMTLIDAETGEVVATTTIDANGLYKFSNLAVGDYWVNLNAGTSFSVAGSSRQRATIGDVVNFAVHPRNFALELSGSFDYLLKEEIHFQFAGQLRDVDTGVPISGAYVEFAIYGPDGLPIRSDSMIEQRPGTYVYTSAETLKDLKWEKGIYLVICDAALEAGAETCATAMIQFHIDPPSDSNLMASSVSLTIGAVGIVSGAGFSGLFLKRRRDLRKRPH